MSKHTHTFHRSLVKTEVHLLSKMNYFIAILKLLGYQLYHCLTRMIRKKSGL